MKLVSVNIEGDLHFDSLIPFLRKENVDIVCMQEVYEADLPYLEAETGMTAVYWPTLNVPLRISPQMAPKGKWGIATFSKSPPSSHKEIIVAQPPATEGIPEFHGDAGHIWRTSVIATTFMVSDTYFNILNTHFTWTENGETSEMQKSHMNKLLDILSEEKEFVLSGDFNAPRGNKAWGMLAARYKDNIPADVTTTIDNTVHHHGKLDPIMFVVDGIFTSPEYEVKNLRVVDGVSDHCAIVAEVTKR